jgi:UDP-N-acetyl-D-mannosaminuronic acid dehydrogenase
VLTEPGKDMFTADFTVDVVIVGGCGRVGLPLGIALASRGLRVTLYDINAVSVEVVNSGTLPFDEEGAAGPLARAVADGTLRATTEPSSVGTAHPSTST